MPAVLCPLCRYDLRMHTAPGRDVRCPECGGELSGPQLAPKGFHNRYVRPYLVRFKLLLLVVLLPPPTYIGMIIIGFFEWYEFPSWPIWYKVLYWSLPVAIALLHVILAHRCAVLGHSPHPWRAALVAGPLLTAASCCVYFMLIAGIR